MQATVGDRLHVRGSVVGQPERTGEIVEVRGAGGEPPYLVRFEDDHTAWYSPARTRHRASAQEGQEGADERRGGTPGRLARAGSPRRRCPGTAQRGRDGSRPPTVVRHEDLRFPRCGRGTAKDRARQDITAQFKEFARTASGGGDGLLHVLVPHATAGVAVIELGVGSDADFAAACLLWASPQLRVSA